jgi:hypothetical protein
VYLCILVRVLVWPLFYCGEDDVVFFLMHEIYMGDDFMSTVIIEKWERDDLLFSPCLFE